VIYRPTVGLRWDDLDLQGCTDHGAPEWNSTTVVGPTKLRDGHGNVTLQWTVTVHCARAGAVDPAEPPPSAGVTAA
jgi:hypothetical protein